MENKGFEDDTSSHSQYTEGNKERLESPHDEVHPTYVYEDGQGDEGLETYADPERASLSGSSKHSQESTNKYDAAQPTTIITTTQVATHHSQSGQADESAMNGIKLPKYEDIEYEDIIEKQKQKALQDSKSGTNPFFIFFGIVLALGFVLALTLGLIFGESNDDLLLDKYTYGNAAVAADHQTCSTIGKNILKQGGSAADAGIAAMLCVGLVNCQSAGIGGGHFTTFYNRTDNSVLTINAREKAPLAAHEEMFVGTYNASVFGGLAVGVPGEFHGYYELHQRAGRLPWKDLITPSIELARDGFPIGGSLAGAINRYDDLILADKSLREVFCDENGNLLQENDTITFPKLAVTLQTVADSGGSDVFYHGELAATIASEVQARGGIITTEDLAKYHTEVDENPLVIKLDDYTVYSPRPPASGAVASYIMNILDGYNLSPDSVTSNNIGLTYHRIAEAFKFGFAKRARLGDDDFEDVEGVVEYMISEDAAESTRQRISDDETHEPEYYDGGEFSFKEDGGTTHVSVIDAEGNALALSSTINLILGSKVRGNITGIIYNNEMDDFSTPNTTNYFGVPASPENFIEPEKRPMSSMVPMVIVDRDGDVRLVTGGAGGTTITTAAVLVAMHSLWFGDNVREAFERRRIHHQLYPPYIRYEERTQEEILEGLAERGHDLQGRTTIAVVQLITKEDNKIYAISDPRKSGHGADGY
ncbi:glutathione hydrolase 1 proenzyme-like [Amphiura filiformis]|uniref:glutathione hydrolase 1 proenzyme-like n=1 Tax=Amphiura filiformis TaxID=82378 RepID=UPI003B223357